jgi:hypothetical protein
MMGILFPISTDDTLIIELKRSSSFISLSGQGVSGHPPTKDANFWGNIRFPNQVPNRPISIWATAATSQVSLLMFHRESEAICTFNREVTVSFIVPCHSVLCVLLRDVDGHDGFNIMLLKQFTKEFHIPGFGSREKKLVHPSAS